MDLDELIAEPGGGRTFERTIRPGLSDGTGSGRVRLDAIARWLQDVAYADVDDAGLADRGAWVVRRNRIAVRGFPRFGEEVTLRTFCSASAALVAERRTSISGGSAQVESVALWVHIDPGSGAPARLGREFELVYGASAAGRRARSRLRHPDPDPDAARSPWSFRASDTDIAGHVNNAAHWQIVEETFLGSPEPGAIDVEIEFREPVQPGEVAVLRGSQAMWVVGLGGEVHSSIVGADSGR